MSDPDPPSPWAPPPPSRSEVAAKFRNVLDGSESRESVSVWARPWLGAAGDPGIRDAAVWEALTLLGGIDLRNGPDQPYLHPPEQVAEWLAELENAE